MNTNLTQPNTFISNFSITEMAVVGAPAFAVYKMSGTPSLRKEMIMTAIAAFLAFNKAAGDAQFLGTQPDAQFDVKNFSFVELATIGLSFWSAYRVFKLTGNTMVAAACAVPGVATALTAGKSKGSESLFPRVA